MQRCRLLPLPVAEASTTRRSAAGSTTMRLGHLNMRLADRHAIMLREIHMLKRLHLSGLRFTRPVAPPSAACTAPPAPGRPQSHSFARVPIHSR